MQVAFISECSTFYKIISNSLMEKYPSLSFVHYGHPDILLETKQPNFSHFILKLTDRESFDLKIRKIKKNNPNSTSIGLIINREFKTLQSVVSSFDYIFNDAEIEEKLNIFFQQQLATKTDLKSENFKLNIEKNKKKYIQLNTKLSRCLVLISENKTAREIAEELSKSQRTIEKYTNYLREYFNVDRKVDLIKIVKEISGN
jgi:DNA-binding CsgD family transcriptional regulator